MRQLYANVANKSTLRACLQVERVTLASGERWLDTVFQGQYLQSLSINYVAIKKIWKNSTTTVLDKDENLL